MVHWSSPTAAKRPLRQTTILVTRTAEQSPQFTSFLQAHGATVLELPALTIMPPASWTGLDAAIAQLETFDWVMFTSANGVEFFFQRLTTAQQLWQALARVKVAVVGRKTASCLRQYGLQPSFVPSHFVSDALVTELPQQVPVKGLRVLYPRLEAGGRDAWVDQLRELGAQVVSVPAYHSGCPESVPLSVMQQLTTVDVVTFASPKTVQHGRWLLERNGVEVDRWLQSVCIASIGPQTSIACRNVLGRVDVEPTEYTLEGLSQAIIDWKQSRV